MSHVLLLRWRRMSQHRGAYIVLGQHRRWVSAVSITKKVVFELFQALSDCRLSVDAGPGVVEIGCALESLCVGGSDVIDCVVIAIVVFPFVDEVAELLVGHFVGVDRSKNLTFEKIIQILVINGISCRNNSNGKQYRDQ